MKIPPTLNKIAVLTGLAIGAFALSALATGGAWTAPHSTPPTCITNPNDDNFDPGCLAPINVGVEGDIIGQTKFNPLSLHDLLVDHSFTLANGSQHAGYVLQSDANGIATWVSTSSLGISFSNATTTNNYYNLEEDFATRTHYQIRDFNGVTTIDTPTSWTVPAGVTSIKIGIWGGGGGGSYGGFSGNGGSAGLCNSSCDQQIVAVTPGQVLVIEVGGGGLSGLAETGNPTCAQYVSNGYGMGRSGYESSIKMPGGGTYHGYSGGGGVKCSGPNGSAGIAIYGSGGEVGSSGSTGAVHIHYSITP